MVITILKKFTEYSLTFDDTRDNDEIFPTLRFSIMGVFPDKKNRLCGLNLSDAGILEIFHGGNISIYTNIDLKKFASKNWKLNWKFVGVVYPEFKFISIIKLKTFKLKIFKDTNSCETYITFDEFYNNWVDQKC